MPSYNPSIPIYPKGHIFGLTLSNNGSDATNDIDIAAGQCLDSTGVIFMTPSALTKRLDAGWAAGTNQGMRNSGAAITDTTYHIYAVCQAGGANPDIYAHTSTTVATVITALQAETGGSAYAFARRIGSIVRISGAILTFVQTGDLFEVSGIGTEVTASPSIGTAAATATLTKCPTGLKLPVELQVRVDCTSPEYVIFTDLDAADIDPLNSTLGDIGGDEANTPFLGTARVVTNTSAQVRYRVHVGDAGTTLRISTKSWTDTRGRFA